MPSNIVLVNDSLEWIVKDSKMDALVQYLDVIGQGKGAVKKVKKGKK